MKILVTGAKGFIGKNLIAELKNRNCGDVLEYDLDTDVSLLESYCSEAEFVFHLAGVNRTKQSHEFVEGNVHFTATLLDTLHKHNNTSPVMMSSSVQASLDNPYGRSKKAGEDLLFRYGRETGAKVLVYRFPNVFGKWCKPNYNSVVATFCYNISRCLPIDVHDPSVVMKLAYVDDVVSELLSALNGCETKNGEYCEVPICYTTTLGEIVDLLYSFRKSRQEKTVPNMSNEFIKKLYSTYLSYLPPDQFSYELEMKTDQRGSFTEFIKTPDRGQISVNISRPGVTKGNHWHHSKNEKFLVVSGRGVIRLRQIDSQEVVEYLVDGDKLEVVDIPVGYTHNIENLGDTDLITLMWANEPFDQEKPDTHFLEV